MQAHLESCLHKGHKSKGRPVKVSRATGVRTRHCSNTCEQALRINLADLVQMHARLLARRCRPKYSDHRHLIDGSAFQRSIRNVHFRSWPGQVVVYGNQPNQKREWLSTGGHRFSRMCCYLWRGRCKRGKSQRMYPRDHRNKSRLLATAASYAFGEWTQRLLDPLLFQGRYGSIQIVDPYIANTFATL